MPTEGMLPFVDLRGGQRISWGLRKKLLIQFMVINDGCGDRGPRIGYDAGSSRRLCQTANTGQSSDDGKPHRTASRSNPRHATQICGPTIRHDNRRGYRKHAKSWQLNDSSANLRLANKQAL